MKNTILCGTGYGAVYLPLLAGLPEFNLIGIFSRGSEKSKAFANRLSVTNYTELTDLPDNIDLAVIAISGDAGFEAARSFLNRGVHVLIEHPVAPSSYEPLHKLSKENSCVLFVNSHFRYTSAIDRFICRIKEESEKNPNTLPNSVVANVSSRTLFSALDFLVDCFGRPSSESMLSQKNKDYQQWLIQFESCPVLLNYQSWQNTDDTGDDVCMGHSVQAFYPQKTIQLANTWGPVLEQRQPSQDMNIPLVNISNDLDNAQSVFMSRRKANQHILKDMLIAIDTGVIPYEQSAQHLIAVSELWQKIKYIN